MKLYNHTKVMYNIIEMLPIPERCFQIFHQSISTMTKITIPSWLNITKWLRYILSMIGIAFYFNNNYVKHVE